MRRTETRRPIRLTESRLRQIIREVIKESDGGLSEALAPLGQDAVDDISRIWLGLGAIALVGSIAGMIHEGQFHVIECTLPNSDINNPELIAKLINQSVENDGGASINAGYKGRDAILSISTSEGEVVLNLGKSGSRQILKLTNLVLNQIDNRAALPDKDVKALYSIYRLLRSRFNPDAPGVPPHLARSVSFK